MTISCIKISAERCLPLWPGAGMSPVPGHTAKFAPHIASLNTVKTNHKIVILFTGEKFITIMGGQSKEKLHNSGLCKASEGEQASTNRQEEDFISSNMLVP